MNLNNDAWDPRHAQASTDGAQMAGGSFVSLVATVVSSLRAIFTFLVARLLGEVVLGHYAVAFAATDLVSKVGTFGLDGASTAIIARHHALGDIRGCQAVFARALRWGLATSVVTTFACVLTLRLVEALHPDGAELIGTTSLMLLALPGIMLYRVSTGVSRGMRVMSHDIYSRGLTESIVTIAAFLIALAIGVRQLAPVIAVLAGTLAGGLVALVLASGLFRQAPGRQTPGPPPPGRPPIHSQESLLRFSAPIAASTLLNTMTMRMDVLLLGVYAARGNLTVATLGVFAAAVDMASLLRKLRQVFDPMFTPVVAGCLARGDVSGAQEIFAQVGRWVLTIQLSLLGVFWLGGGALLSLLGPEFRAGWWWLAILALAHATNTFVGLGELVILVERPVVNTINGLVTTVVQLGASVWLIGIFGPAGAAAGTLLAFAVQGVLRFSELRVLFGWALPWRAFRRPVAAFLVAFVPAVAIRAGLGIAAGELTAIAVFISLYGLAWKTLGLDPADRLVLENLRRNRRIG